MASSMNVASGHAGMGGTTGDIGQRRPLAM